MWIRAFSLPIPCLPPMEFVEVVVRSPSHLIMVDVRKFIKPYSVFVPETRNRYFVRVEHERYTKTTYLCFHIDIGTWKGNDFYGFHVRSFREHFSAARPQELLVLLSTERCLALTNCNWFYKLWQCGMLESTYFVYFSTQFLENTPMPYKTQGNITTSTSKSEFLQNISTFSTQLQTIAKK